MFDLTPELMLAMWAGGIATASVAVVLWRIVGAGFVWLAAGVVVLAGGSSALTGGGPGAWIGTALGAAAGIAARHKPACAALFAGSAVALAAAAVPDGGFLLAVTGTAALGAITSEMLLGHWYLVDPQLPRWALRVLAVSGLAAIVADIAVLIGRGALGWESDDAIIGWAFLALAAFTALLMVAVYLSLKEPAYPAVMAATGLSYLAVLTAFGATVLGRALLDATGVSPVG